MKSETATTLKSLFTFAFPLFLLCTPVPFGHAFQLRGVRTGGDRFGLSSFAPAARSSIERNAAGTLPPCPRKGVTTIMSEATAPESSERGIERRHFLANAARSIVLSSVGGVASDAQAAEAGGGDLPDVTRKVFLDVRISRADGTFYVRDTLPDAGAPADEPFYGRLVLGLFGDRAPNHVEQFLKYIDVPYDVDSPLPSYSRSKFQTLDASTGLLIGGTIPGLEATTLAGGNVLEYSGRVIPARLWLEDRNKQTDNSAASLLSHNRRGLLTHRNLDLTPSFGVTTRVTSVPLDTTHTIFGCILEDEGGFLEKVVDLPVLTDEGRVSRTANEPAAVGGSGGVVGSLASSVFTAQRAVFRDAAKTFGDSRLDKVYDGKLLRRIEVTKVGIL